uniref:DUF4440 domain-containing protein n=1 Tax=mine drainage metagenome TaxID=410659 RepID=E6QK41_9ZZZZ
MRLRWIGLVVVCIGLLAGVQLLAAQSLAGDDAAIRAVMAAQVAAWNRGDIPGFLKGYENSPETTFIGSSIAHGYEPILERYRKAYADKAQMGTLRFNELSVRLLPTSAGVVEYAVVTGRFHLDRTAKGTATKDDGMFSLVWRKGADGWKILLDHTS